MNSRHEMWVIDFIKSITNNRFHDLIDEQVDHFQFFYGYQLTMLIKQFSVYIFFVNVESTVSPSQEYFEVEDQC